MHAWFCSNCLALNPDKTDTIVFGTHRRSQSAAAMTSVNVVGVLVKPSDKIKLLSATLDNKLTLTGHVSAVCKVMFFHIRALRHIQSILTEDTAKTVACVLVGSLLTTPTQFLYGVSGANIHKLQRMQNTIAWVVRVLWRYLRISNSCLSGIASTLKSQHWLQGEIFVAAGLTFVTHLRLRVYQKSTFNWDSHSAHFSC